MNISRVVFQYVRIVSKIQSKINYVRFSLYGVKFGKGFCVHGFPCLFNGHGATFHIGEGFYMSNGSKQNPLNKDIRGAFHVNDNALLEIGDGVGMSSTTVWCHSCIIIKNHVCIGANTVLIDSDCHSLDYIHRRSFTIDQLHKKCAPIVVEDNVLIGANCIVLKGVTIGARSVVGAGSVVTRSVPPDSVVAGNPAKVVKPLV